MNPQDKDSPLAASAAASRRLLRLVLDLHFDLADTIEQVDGGQCVTAADVRHLRHAAAAIQETIDRLADEIYPSTAPCGEEAVEEECGEAVA